MKRIKHMTAVILTAAILLSFAPMCGAEDAFYVYKDNAFPENHFHLKAKMSGGDPDLVYTMNEAWTDQPYDGESCIRCQINTVPGDWGGWLFLNGYTAEGKPGLQMNDGTTPGQGEDLSGAAALKFCARGQTGREQIEFFCCGFGYEGDGDKPTVYYPDSALKQSTKLVELSTRWTEYTIPLDGLDLSNICCGFGYVGSGDATGEASNLFFLDEIRFVR